LPEVGESVPGDKDVVACEWKTRVVDWPCDVQGLDRSGGGWLAGHTYGAVTDWRDEVGRRPLAPDRRRPLEGIHYPWRPTVRLSARPSICWSAVY